MGLEKIIKKSIIFSSIITTLAYNTPVKAENIESYLQQKIIQLENKKIEALKTQYFLEEITELKKEYNKKYLNEIKQNKDFSWNNPEKIIFTTSSLLALLDCYQTANLPKDKKEDYKIIKYKEGTNPLIISLFGERPSEREMLLWYATTTTAWYLTSDLIPKHLTNHILPKKYNKYTRKLMLSLGNIYYLNYVINNERVTGGIIFKF